jgi:hypothetical protein
MPAALEVPVTLLRLRERESSVDHRVQAMQSDCAVHRFEIGATADSRVMPRPVNNKGSRWYGRAARNGTIVAGKPAMEHANATAQ